MRNYEVTFIVDPVLSGDEIKSTAQTYEKMLKQEKFDITHIDEMGLRQLAYPINKRSSGIYYTIEFAGEALDIISKLELSMTRDERIMRFLTIKLDKYGVKYNDDKRKGLIGKKKPKEEAKPEAEKKGKPAAARKAEPKATPPPPAAEPAAVAKPEAAVAAAPVVAEKVIAEAPTVPVATSEEE